MLSQSKVSCLAALLFSSASLVSAQVQTCNSFGVDFQSGGSYFINTLSNDDFTAVSEFTGCQEDTASIMLVDPNENGYMCSDVPITPDNTPEMTTCNIEKSQMFTGEWSLLILSNNGATGIPIDYQRDFYITAGPQQTSTVYPTVTYTVTTTPVISATNTSTVSIVSTVNNTKTITEPAKTAYLTKTPAATTSTNWRTVTKTYKKWTATKTVIWQTITPTCVTPPRQNRPDPICTIRPKNLPWPPKKHNKRDSAIDSGAVRARFNAIVARQAAGKAALEARTTPAPEAGLVKRIFEKRSADAETITTTVLTPVVNSTITFTASPTTSYNYTLVTETDFITLPPKTVHTGVVTITTWAPTPTKTKVSLTYAATTVTKTWTATQWHKTTVVPAASATQCKRRGGHWGWQN